MSTIEQPVEVDGEKLMQFVFRAVDEVGATLNAALVVMGDKLGLYRAHGRSGASRPAELAERTGTAERYVREWLNAQAAGGYVDLRPGQRSLHPPAGADGRAHRPGQPRVPAGLLPGRDRLGARLAEDHRGGPQTGTASAGTSTSTMCYDGCERFFRPGYNANLISGWLPALDGVVEKLERGALVADVGCGHGASTILMAQAFPNSTFVGSDYHGGSIETARQRAEEAGVSRPGPLRGRAGLGVRRQRIRPGDDVRLPARHGRPGGCRPPRARSTLKPDGTWMIVEPSAGDRVEDNLNPVGRAYYGFSTLLCTPASLSQEVGLALGAQAGEARIRTSSRRAASPGSAARPRLRSTWCSRPGREMSDDEQPSALSVPPLVDRCI